MGVFTKSDLLSVLRVASIVAEAEAGLGSEPARSDPRKSRYPRRSPSASAATDATTRFRDYIRDGVFCLDPLAEAPGYSFSMAYYIVMAGGGQPALSSRRRLLSEEATSSQESEAGEVPAIFLSKPTKPPQTPEKSPRVLKPRTPKGASSSEDELQQQLAFKDFFPGGSKGVHVQPGTPTSIEHRQKLYERVLQKRRAGQSIGGVRPGNPLEVTRMPASEFLTDIEFELCSGLRLSPAQYFHSRKVLLDNFWKQGWFNKSAAQKMLRIDVNKTGKLWEFLVRMNWMPEKPHGPCLQPPHDL